MNMEHVIVAFVYIANNLFTWLSAIWRVSFQISRLSHSSNNTLHGLQGIFVLNMKVHLRMNPVLCMSPAFALGGSLIHISPPYFHSL